MDDRWGINAKQIRNPLAERCLSMKNLSMNKPNSIMASLTAKYCEEQPGLQCLLQIFRQALRDGGVEESRARNILLQVEGLLDKHMDELKRAVADS